MMFYADLIGFGLFLGYFIFIGLPMLLLKVYFHISSEVMRKILHMVITLSIFPLMKLFSTWYMSVLAAFTFVLILYPVLKRLERTSVFKRVAVEREDGEFKRSLIIVQVSLATLITVFWGFFGNDWQYIAVVAVMAWGFGDAAAALVGKRFGRRQISHRWIEGTKTVEGTFAMFAVAAIAIFITLLMYAGHPWQVSIMAALIVAPICSTVELFSHRGMDTLTVPLSTAFAIMPLMSLFSFLGM